MLPLGLFWKAWFFMGHSCCGWLGRAIPAIHDPPNLAMHRRKLAWLALAIFYSLLHPTKPFADGGLDEDHAATPSSRSTRNASYRTRHR